MSSYSGKPPGHQINTMLSLMIIIRSRLHHVKGETKKYLVVRSHRKPSFVISIHSRPGDVAPLLREILDLSLCRDGGGDDNGLAGAGAGGAHILCIVSCHSGVGVGGRARLVETHLCLWTDQSCLDHQQKQT